MLVQARFRGWDDSRCSRQTHGTLFKTRMPRLVNRVLLLDIVSLYSASGNWLANLNLRLTDSGNWVREVVEALGVSTSVVLLVEIDPSLRSDLVVEPGRQRRHIHMQIIFNTGLLLSGFRLDRGGVPYDGMTEEDRCWVCDLPCRNIHRVNHGFGMHDWHPRRGMFTCDDQFAVLGPLLQWLSQEVLAWSSPVELCGLCSKSKAHLVVQLTSSPREQWMRSYVQMLRIDGLGLAWCECVGGAGDMVHREEEALDELLRRRRDQHRQEGARVQDALALANFEGVDLML